MKTLKLISHLIQLKQENLLYDFQKFQPEDWSITRHSPPWQVTPEAVIGGKPDEETHGQIFYKTPVQGDIVMEFDAELVGKSYHDIIWWWSTSLEQSPWGEGYLGCLGGWWNNLSGIEKSPTFEPSCIVPTTPIQPQTKYHIISGGAGTMLFIFVDGVLSCYMTDLNPATIKGGYFGFGVFESNVRYSNLKVYRPEIINDPHSYIRDSQLHMPEQQKADELNPSAFCM